MLRSIYLRLSVTDLCDLRCIYCRSADGVDLKPRDEIMSFEEMVDHVKLIDGVTPIRKLRLTGGEPLVRRDITRLVGMLRQALPNAEIAMTTNGHTLFELAGELKSAGLERVNISLDTLKPERFEYITRGGDLRRVLAGIDAAIDAGLTPVKINTVLLRGINDDELADIVRFASERGLVARFVELMPTPASESLGSRVFMSVFSALKIISRRIDVEVASRSSSGYMVCRAALNGGPVRFEFIPSMTGPFCDTCNRLRLDSTARLFPCLLSDEHIDLRSFGDEAAAAAEVKRLVSSKHPPSVRRRSTSMSSIGG
ncbi:MAG TPA: GTP 3',8-cyclase MoaA [Proteobacteria bacterium]|nr:GTP 3',8-cyclase MoaA [Pseudomonadota bacterium]